MLPYSPLLSDSLRLCVSAFLSGNSARHLGLSVFIYGLFLPGNVAVYRVDLLLRVPPHPLPFPRKREKGDRTAPPRPLGAGQGIGGKPDIDVTL
jgi:hypothetical protein